MAAARLAQPSYAWAYHDIYQSQLPVYITLDSIFHAVFAAHDNLLEQIEHRELQPRLSALLAARQTATVTVVDAVHDHLSSQHHDERQHSGLSICQREF